MSQTNHKIQCESDKSFKTVDFVRIECTVDILRCKLRPGPDMGGGTCANRTKASIISGIGIESRMTSKILQIHLSDLSVIRALMNVNCVLWPTNIRS